MTRDILQEQQRPSGGCDGARWLNLINDDASGNDGDIEKLIELWRSKYGYTHDKAKTKLVVRLSSLARTDLVCADTTSCS